VGEFGRDYLEWLRQNWRRDLAALPIVTLLVMLATSVLFPGISLVDRFLASMILGVAAWPIGHWVVDHTLRR
jgi:predicted PurR-regulated permease PerM